MGKVKKFCAYQSEKDKVKVNFFLFGIKYKNLHISLYCSSNCKRSEIIFNFLVTSYFLA